MNPPVLHELRVLSGEQRGARVNVAHGRPVIVSSDWNSDVVLRGPDMAGRRVALTIAGDGVQLRVLEGSVRVGDRELAAGEAVQLPLHAPLHVGRTALAVGLGGDARWDAPAAAATSTSTAAAAARPASRQRTAWPRALLAIGGVLASGSIGAIALAYAATPHAPTPAEAAAQSQAALQRAGFTRLAAQPGADGEVLVSGYLQTAAQRLQVERLLAAGAHRARLSVWVDDELAASVREVYRVNGIPAQVETSGPGAVVVHTQEADGVHLAQVQATARRDVAGLSAIDAQNTAPARPRTPAAAPVDDPGKRIASVVNGSPAYLVTADGTRYFEGALLPTGHRIAGIAADEVKLDLDGALTTLRF